MIQRAPTNTSQEGARVIPYSSWSSVPQYAIGFLNKKLTAILVWKGNAILEDLFQLSTSLASFLHLFARQKKRKE